MVVLYLVVPYIRGQRLGTNGGINTLYLVVLYIRGQRLETNGGMY